MKFSRSWAIPDRATFNCPPIGEFVKKYLANSDVSIDPFARNCQWATYTNDIDLRATAQYHLDVLVFLSLMRCRGIQADLIIFDPPYSPRQIKECFSGMGLPTCLEDAQRSASWVKEKNLCDNLLMPGGIFLYFGWDSVGMGITRGYVIEEIMLVCHGPQHNDTICLAERKRGK